MNYKRCKHSCDYVVRFSSTNKDNFGLIDQFFIYKSVIYVVLYELKCTPYDFFKDFIIAEELNDFDFNSFYYIITGKSKSRIIIDHRRLVNKCILFNIKKRDLASQTFLTDFIYDGEHD